MNHVAKPTLRHPLASARLLSGEAWAEPGRERQRGTENRQASRFHAVLRNAFSLEMIECYQGTVGASKTYHAVLYICKRLAAGRIVGTNIDLNVDKLIAYVADRFGVEVDPAQIIDLRGEGTIPADYRIDRKGFASSQRGGKYDPKPGDTVEKISLFYVFTPPTADIVIDEAQVWFDAEQNADCFDECFYFLTQSRKFNNDIIFITQHVANINKRFKRLFEFVWSFRDMEKVTINGVCRWPLPQFKVTQRDRFGNIMWSKLVPKDKAVFKLYNTDAMLSTIQRAPVPVFKKGVKNNKLKRRRMLKFYGILICVLTYILIANGISVNPFAPWQKRAKESTERVVERDSKSEDKSEKRDSLMGPPDALKPPTLDDSRPKYRDVAVIKTGDYGGKSRTAIGEIYLQANTPIGVVTAYDEVASYFTTVDSNGTIYRVTMLFPSFAKDQKSLLGSGALVDFTQSAGIPTQ